MILSKKNTFIFALATLSFLPTSFAAKFANQFVEFELPANWNCLLEGAEWVCQNQQDPTKKKEAIIILAAKIQGDQDTLDQYLAYLKNPKTYNTPQGKSVTSQVKFAQDKSIADHPWVDALHLESEIPGFFTRYLATIKDGIGVLVTYSINRNKYQEYSPVFETLVKSLRVFRREGGLNAAPAESDLFANAKIPTGMSDDSAFGNIYGADDSAKSKKQVSGGLAALMNDPVLFYGSLAGVGLVLVSVLKKLKKK